MKTTDLNYRTLAHAIVLQAMKDAEGDEAEAHRARQWLAVQGVCQPASRVTRNRSYDAKPATAAVYQNEYEFCC